MKYLLFLILFLPFIGNAQVDKDKVRLSPGLQDSLLETSFILKDNTVLFQKVYTSEMDKNALLLRLKSFLPSVKNFQLTDSPNQNEFQLSGKISDYVVNYRKYGGSLFGTNSLMNNALQANVIIQIKDNKYRIIISDGVYKNVSIISSVPPQNITFDDMFTRKKRTAFRTSETVLECAKYIDKDFTDSFDLNKSNKVSDNF